MIAQTQNTGAHYLCTVVFDDTKNGATYSRGWWTVCVDETDIDGQYRVVGTVPDSEDRALDGRVFLSFDENPEIRALCAARRFFPEATGIRRGKFGYDVFG